MLKLVFKVRNGMKLFEMQRNVYEAARIKTPIMGTEKFLGVDVVRLYWNFA